MSVRAISHHDQVSVFVHLGELRVRLIVSVAALAIAFTFAFWQNHAVLQVLNRPLTNAGSPALTDSSAPLSETAGTGEQRDLVRALIKQVLITPGRGRQRVDVQEMPDIADPIEIR